MNCYKMDFSCFSHWVNLVVFESQKLLKSGTNFICLENELNLVKLALKITSKPPPSTLKPTLPPPAVDSISDKKTWFKDIFFSLNDIFLSRPVSTACPKDSIGAWGIKGGGL